MADKSVIIVGGGLAGAKTAEALRDCGYRGSITLVGAERVLPYERPPLSKAVLLGKAEADSAFVHDAEWYDQRDVALSLGLRAVGLEPSRHIVTLEDGAELPYDQLVIATGSHPRPVPIAGADLPGVHYLRTMEQSLALRRLFAQARRVAIVGGGWIGLEVAAAGRAAGVDITVLEAAQAPLLGVLGPEAAQIFTRLHEKHGVDVRTGVSVESLTGDGRVAGVRLEGGEEFDVDGVVVGVGVTPNVALAEAAGLEVDDGILVDEHLRTADPDVFAVGDVANAWHPLLGRRIRVEHWANALHQPAVAAQAIVGGAAVYDRLPYFFTDQYDLGMEYVGYAGHGDYDRVVFRGEPDQGITFWLSAGRVLAGMSVNIWDVVEDIRGLITSGRQVDADRLADPAVALADI